MSSKVLSRYRMDFEELEVLGKGGFGQVCKVRNQPNQLTTAACLLSTHLHLTYRLGISSMEDSMQLKRSSLQGWTSSRSC